MKILLLTKRTDYCKQVQDYAKKFEVNLTILEGDWGEKFPELNWEGDYIISYLCPWIIKAPILEKANHAINFHPAPPEYPGIGCYNFAIYNGDEEYGVTCHEMAPIVDSGKIIKVARFSMDEDETPMSLKVKSMDVMFNLFKEIFELIIQEKTLPLSEERWSRKAYTRKDFQELCKITLDMNKNEIVKRLRATYFPGARDAPYILIDDKKFVLDQS